MANVTGGAWLGVGRMLLRQLRQVKARGRGFARKGREMKSKTRGGLLVGAGFLLGTVGVKALTSQTAKKCYVQGVAKGLQAKSAYENIVEQAKAQVDDIVAEASYVNSMQTDVAVATVADTADASGSVGVGQESAAKQDE